MIVLVEDDIAIGRSVSQGLAARGFAVHWLRRGADLAAQVAGGEVRVVILDLGLPDGDGLDLCRGLRAAGHDMPILMLTARGGLDDRLEGFEAGTDDYLTKPFAFAELVARVAVLVRRAAQLPPVPLAWGRLSIDRAAGTVHWDGAVLALEPRAVALLAELARGRGEVVGRGALADAVWGAAAVISDNTIDVAISALRRRLAEAAPVLAIRAVKGRGFVLDGADLIP